jgi:FMN phosphatase YigB (HAD superfamily)
LEAVFTAMGIAVPDRDVAAGIEALMRGALAGASPTPGAVDTIHAIDRAGVTIGVVSSAVYHPFLEWALDAFGVLPAIRAIITSASVGFYKSRPEIYELAAAAIDADPVRVVHVGDSLRFDVGGASRAGMGTVWLQHEQTASADQTIVPDLTLRTLEGSAPQILRLLERRVNGREPARGHA